MPQYYVIELQKRADGVVNTVPTVTKNGFSAGLSYFYERCSKMSVTDLFTEVTVALVDFDLNIIKMENIICGK